jgi:hypothetical protein
MGGRWNARRIELNPSVGARFRYACEGWGLIQLYFGAIKNGQLSSCHTNHFSAKRAESWEGIVAKRESAHAWDFNAVNRMSSRLNRFVRGRGVAKWGSYRMICVSFSIGTVVRESELVPLSSAWDTTSALNVKSRETRSHSMTGSAC